PPPCGRPTPSYGREVSLAPPIPGTGGVSGYIEATVLYPTGSLMSVTRARVPMVVGTLLGGSLVAPAGGNGDWKSDKGSGGLQDALHSQSVAPEVPQPVLHTNVAKGASSLPVDHRVTLTTKNGTLTSVSVSSKSGSISGTMTGDKRTWTAGGLLEPGTSYTVVSRATGESSKAGPRSAH